MHRQSAGTPPSGSRTQDHDRLFEAALPRALPRRAGLPVPVSIERFCFPSIHTRVEKLHRSIARFPPTCFSAVRSVADTTTQESKRTVRERENSGSSRNIRQSTRRGNAGSRVAFEKRTVQCVFQLLDSRTDQRTLHLRSCTRSPSASQTRTVHYGSIARKKTQKMYKS